MLPQAQIFVSVLPDGTKQQSTFYTFASVGDEIPLHTHAHWHNCQVLQGSVRIYDGKGRELIVKAGGLAGLGANKPHAIQALEAATKTMHTNEPGK